MVNVPFLEPIKQKLFAFVSKMSHDRHGAGELCE